MSDGTEPGKSPHAIPLEGAESRTPLGEVQIDLSPARRRLLLVMLAGFSMIGPFSIDTFFPAFPAMMAALDANAWQMQQTLSIYLVAYAVMSLFHGGASDALGRRPVILFSTAIFVLASVGCALSTSFESLLAFRFIQGLSAGAGSIVGRAIVRDCFAGAEAQRAMSLIHMLFGIAPAVAPIVGGYLLVFGWESSFWFLTLFALALIALAMVALPETCPPPHRHPWSLRGLAKGYAEIVASARFRWLALCAGFNFAAVFVYISSAPVFVLEHLGFNEQQFAAFFVPTIAGMVMGAFAAGRMAGRWTAARGVRVAFLVMAVGGMINLAQALLVDQPAWPWAVLPITLIAVGVATAFPLLSLMMLDLFPARRGGNSSMQMFISLCIQATVAGGLAPTVNGSFLALAVTSLGLTAIGWSCWLIAGAVERGRPADAG